MRFALPAGQPIVKLDLGGGIFLAVLLHAGIILIGGFLFSGHKPDRASLQKVELLSEDEIRAEEEKKEEQTPQELEEVETEEAPDATEAIKSLETSSAAPALDAASLSAIEAALGGAGGGGDFASAMDFASGGRIGGTGKAGMLGDKDLDVAFSLGEIDQKPRAVFQQAPTYPSNMRKMEGVVTVLFIVDASGKVINPKVERSTHPAYEKPALDAVRQWRFEPAVKGGKRVPCKMRVPIRFQPQ